MRHVLVQEAIEREEIEAGEDKVVDGVSAIEDNIKLIHWPN
jgi:hypothetical protein